MSAIPKLRPIETKPIQRPSGIFKLSADEIDAALLQEIAA